MYLYLYCTFLNLFYTMVISHFFHISYTYLFIHFIYHIEIYPKYVLGLALHTLLPNAPVQFVVRTTLSQTFKTTTRGSKPRIS